MENAYDRRELYEAFKVDLKRRSTTGLTDKNGLKIDSTVDLWSGLFQK